jgi:hypothetical protein
MTNNMFIRLLRSAILFKSHLQFANLSRVDPAYVSTGCNGSKHFHRLASTAPIVFTSVIVVSSSSLLEPKMTTNSKPAKMISGALIAGEWERFVGAIGMVLWEREFKGQLFRDNLSFMTAPLMVDGKLFYNYSAPY